MAKSAPTLVLLRGLMREARHWGEFAPQLQHALGMPLATPDLAGNGQRCALVSPLSVSAMVEDLRAQLHPIQPPYLLVALSLGGMVALDWAGRYPEEIAGLVLINSSARPLAPLWQRLRPGSWVQLLQLVLQPPHQRETSLWQLTSNRPADAATIHLWQRYASDCPVRLGNGLRQLWAASQFKAALPLATRRPALVLASANDRLVHWRCSNALASAVEAVFQLHPDAGHDLPLDDGSWCISQIVRWWWQQEATGRCGVKVLDGPSPCNPGL